MIKKEKTGISLIVLVITILVMIILAGVVIVSLQNDNPINKAKYAKNMDSIQNIRAAITQYTVTAQATESDSETFDDKLNKILKDPDGTCRINGEYTKVLKIDKETIKLLGVDPSKFVGESIGYFLINPKTGASVYQFNTPIFDKEISNDNVEGILTNNLIKKQEPYFKNESNQNWIIGTNIKNKMYFQFKSDKNLPNIDINIIAILKSPKDGIDRHIYNFNLNAKCEANKVCKIESFNLKDVTTYHNGKNIFENLDKYKELRIQMTKRPEDKITNYKEVNITELSLINK